MPDTVITLFLQPLDFLLGLYERYGAQMVQNTAIGIGIVLLAWVVEIYYAGWKASSMRRVLFAPTRSTVNDIVHCLLYITGAITILAVLTSLGIPLLIKMAAIQAFGLDMSAQMPMWMALAVYLLMVDFCNYWKHRLLHVVPALWQIHSFHHAATDFNAMTVHREHPLDKALRNFTHLIPAVLLGVPTEQYPMFIAIYGATGYFKHTQIPWRWGWFGKYVLQSPVDHWIHHSNQQEHYDKNFSAVFAIWDQLFGTYYKGELINTEIGLDNSPFNRTTPVHDMLITQRLFLKKLSETAPAAAVLSLFRPTRNAA